jgi:hypothetical protein
MVAPAVGGRFRILNIIGTGTPSSGRCGGRVRSERADERLAQARSELEQAEQEITKLRADIVVQQRRTR